MTFRTRKEEFLAGTAAPVGAAARLSNPTVQPRDGPQPDDSDLLIGYRKMAEFAAAEGCPVAMSTFQKRCSPAIGDGPELIGFFGRLAATDKGRLRVWLRAQLRPSRPVTKRWKAPAITSTQLGGTT
jgi:hypothetical protein